MYVFTAKTSLINQKFWTNYSILKDQRFRDGVCG